MSIPCRECKAPVFMMKSAATGKWAPIDAEPLLNGNIVMELPETYHVVRSDPEVLRHTNHFATCLAASKFRKGKK